VKGRNPLRPARTITALVSLAAALLLAPAVPATAAESGTDLQQRIERVIDDFPGGVQTAANEISWADGDVVLTLADPESRAAARSVGSCATGAHCVYSSTNMQGSRLTFTTCTTSSVAPLGSPVRSIANARGSVVRAYNAIGVVGSVSANSSTNVGWSMTKIGC